MLSVTLLSGSPESFFLTRGPGVRSLEAQKGNTIQYATQLQQSRGVIFASESRSGALPRVLFSVGLGNLIITRRLELTCVCGPLGCDGRIIHFGD